MDRTARWQGAEIELLTSGASARRIGQLTRRSERAVQDKARRLGIKIADKPNPLKWSASTRNRAHWLKSRGKSVRAISDEMGVPFSTVRNWIYSGDRDAH